MTNVVGVRLSPQGRTIDHDAGELHLLSGERVVVPAPPPTPALGAPAGSPAGSPADERRGALVVGLVTVPSASRTVSRPLPRVQRRAQDRDLARLAADEDHLGQALAFARERAHARHLPIKFFRVEFAPGGDRSTFYFSSEQRVDFRELVRDLAARYRHRIELRQVGVRDEAKMVGGIGACGRELCCSTFLPHFAPVTIRMAKNQNLALNPSRVSGQCGRLKCCLVYEEAQYVEAGRSLPRAGKRVQTPDGPGRVEDVDVLASRVRVSFQDRPPAVYQGKDLAPLAPGSGGPPAPPQPAGDD